MSARLDQKSMEDFVVNHLSYRLQAPESIGAMLDFGFVSCSAEEASITLSHKVDVREVNIYNTLHGGIITWLMDSCMGILSRAYTGYETLVTMDVHVNFLRAIYAGDEVVIKATVTHAGSRIVNTVSELYVKDKLMATADAIFYKID